MPIPTTPSRYDLLVGVVVSPLIGALFALVLYIAFVSEILQGSLFPKFTPVPYTGLSTFIENAVPMNTADAAKALFWSFVAGFAEGFVPNFIDKVAREATDDDSERQIDKVAREADDDSEKTE